MYSTIEYMIQTYRLLFSRFRGFVLRVRGGDIGRKNSIGRNCQFLNPRNISLGSRVTLENNVFIKIVSPTAKFAVGDFVFIGMGVEFDILQEVKIGSHVLLAPGVFITDHNHQTVASLRIDQQECIAKPVVIENDVWVGAKAIILPGVTIGRGAVVGAGSVVVNDVEEMTIVAGVPAKLIGRR